jgi:zinc transporter ZupT
MINASLCGRSSSVGSLPFCFLPKLSVHFLAAFNLMAAGSMLSVSMLMLHEALSEAQHNVWQQFGIIVAAALCVPLLALCETYGERWGLLDSEHEEEPVPASQHPLIPIPPTPLLAAAGKVKVQAKVNTRTRLAPASPERRAVNVDVVATPLHPSLSTSAHRTPRRSSSSAAAPTVLSEATLSAPLPVLGLSRRAARFLLSISLHAMAEGFGASGVLSLCYAVNCVLFPCDCCSG